MPCSVTFCTQLLLLQLYRVKHWAIKGHLLPCNICSKGDAWPGRETYLETTQKCKTIPIPRHVLEVIQ